MEILIETVSKWKENSYLIHHGGEGWLIDPGDEFEILDQRFNVANVVKKGIINTHGHFDHVGAAQQFKEKYGLPFYIHSKDKQLVRQGNLYKKLAGSTDFFKSPQPDGFLENMRTIGLADKNIYVHDTPGHTYGSVCFEINNSLISGDLFFKNEIGRVDLPGGNLELLKQSVSFVIERFEGYTIYPGHGAPFVLDGSVVSVLKTYI